MTMSKEQLELRRTGCGSSDIPAIAGISKYRNAIDVFMEKKLPVEETSAALTGRNPAKWGHRLQKLVVDEWAEIKNISSYVFEPGTVRHPKIQIAMASLDAVAVPPNITIVNVEQMIDNAIGACEAKAPGFMMGLDWDDEEAPDDYIVQSQWQMGVTGIRNNFDLCALIGGQDFRMRPIEFDAELFGNLVDIAQQFWTDYVVKDLVPPLDHSDAASEYLRRRFKNFGKEKLVLEGDQLLRAQQLALQKRRAKAAKDAAEEEEKTARNLLAEMCGESAGIAGICSRTQVNKDTYEVKAQSYVEIRLDREKKK